MIPQNFLKQLLDALMQVLLALLKIVLLPFNLWIKAISNLAEQRDKGLLDLNKITGLWPLFTFLKRVFLDFVLDAIAFLSYPIGIFSAFVGFVVSLATASHYVSVGQMMLDAIAVFTAILISTYFTPVITIFINNLTQFLLLPIRKLIDWCKKPAQQLDIDHKQRL